MSKPARAAPRSSRVGAIRDGKIIEERQMRNPVAMTSARTGPTFVIPASELPSSFPVFEYRNSQYLLVFIS